ncbi:hypothetical protein CP970_18095 [Streptomyces kanamyceticus]|uniref:Uncharacterized protein n=1 Tax=Streptomyces kanamyceticus TaxID=1967 RepID=A0A5J6GTX9_STRKN|nr:hypothetical protein CP970_18095 [Streptomyces kanamyceticus]
MADAPVPPEPALRPRAQPGPGVELSRRARLFVDGGDLVLRTRSGTRRLPVGGEGISRAVFVDVGGPDAERMGPPLPGTWGELQLQDSKGLLIGRVRLDDWLPEADQLPQRYVHGEQLLSRTGVAGLLAAAGIPLHTVRDADDPLVDRRTRQRVVSLAPGGVFPAWYWLTRGGAAAVWGATFTALLFSDAAAPWLVLVSAGAALTAPAARLALRAWTRLRLRRHTAPAASARITPRPTSGTRATVRFCRDTELRVERHDLVLKDISGQEHRLARRGPHAVTALVLVRVRSGEPVGVELRGPDGQIRVVLPWRQWFGGDGGRDGWAALRGALALPVTERRVTGQAAWPKGPALGLRLLPTSGRAARAVSRFPRTLVGVSSTAVMAVGSCFSVVHGVRLMDTHPAAAWTAVLMGVLATLLQAIPYVIHQQRGRFLLDRPACG